MPFAAAFTIVNVVVETVSKPGFRPTGINSAFWFDSEIMTAIGAVVKLSKNVSVKTVALAVALVPPVSVINPSMSLPDTVTVAPLPAPAPTAIVGADFCEMRSHFTPS